jgi:hypothetical protein
MIPSSTATSTVASCVLRNSSRCCFFIWCSAPEICLNRTSHTKHSNGFSFVCFRICFLRSYASRAMYRHAKQGRRDRSEHGITAGHTLRWRRRWLISVEDSMRQWMHVMGSESEIQMEEPGSNGARFCPNVILLLVVYRNIIRQSGKLSGRYTVLFFAWFHSSS